MAATGMHRRVEPRVDTLLRYLRTLQYLRPTQIVSRAWRGLHHPRPDLRAAPARRPVSQVFQAPVEGTPALVAAEQFRFLNVEGLCAAASDWHPPGADKLWTYNLHYFDDLSARDADTRRTWHRRLLERWVAENPPAAGVAWEPFPVSRRIVNWVKWSLRGAELPAVCQTSLAVQARWLRSRLEYHLLGNHLLANAKALVHAGLYFSGPEAERWYTHGMSIIERELHEQILADGGHFELSPMYHALVLEDLLDLVNLLRTYARTPPADWFRVIAGMRRWLKVMTHPDGEIAFFNDAAFGVAPTSAALEGYAGRLDLDPVPDPGTTLVALEPSGYVRAVLGPACLLCDCAAVGPDHQPAHAHADTLSFELSLAGRRLFVNSGTSRYEWDPERQRQRGTAAHNTVGVDGQDSSEVWAAFRVARRARAYLQAARATPHEVLIAGSHDGYRRLPGRIRHSRLWRLDEGSLRIEDRISGAFRSATARFHLHPDVAVRLVNGREVELTRTDGALVRMIFEGASTVDVSPSHWYPEFGLAIANHCVVAHFAGSTLATRVVWA
jgi:uncharacterized heparinase superfamily protein